MKVNFKNNAINLSLFLGVFIFCLIIAEFAVRLFFPSPRSPVIFDEKIGYKYKPDSEVTVFCKGNKIANKANSLGFLDEDHSFEKPSDTYRVLFLGDSFTESTNVLRKETFPKMIEKDLNNEGKFEIINMGMNGFGTAHEYMTLKEYGSKFSPDLTILVFFVGNDFENNNYQLTANIDPGFDIREGDLVEVRIPTPLKGGGMRSFLSDYLQLPRFLVHQLSKINLLKNLFVDVNLVSATKELPQGDMPFSLNFFSKELAKETEKIWQVTESLLLKIREALKNNNSEFLVVILPALEQIDSDFREKVLEKYPQLVKMNLDFELPQKKLKNFFDGQNIDYLDLLPVLKTELDNLYQSSDCGGHYTLKGHEIVTGAILDYLKEKDLMRTR